MKTASTIKCRGGTLASRIVTSLLALALSNVLFYLWQVGLIPTFGISLSLLAYLAQAAGSSAGACLDYLGHSRIYQGSVEGAKKPKQWQFYAKRIFFLPVGFVTFVVAYELLDISYLLSSILASVAGWVAGYKSIDKLFMER
jgi:putative flippase GtrA